VSRRAVLGTAIAAAVGWTCRNAFGSQTAPVGTDHRYKISVCDIMLLKRQKLGAIKLAKEIGVDGVEVDMGGLGNRPQFENQLADETIRLQFENNAKDAGVAFSSLAMTAYYAQSFADHPAADRTIEQWIETATAMNIRVGFLPLGVRGDINDAVIRGKIVNRLKNWGPRIERAKLVLGLEANTDATGYNQLLEEIASPAVQVYFNFQSPLKAGLDVGDELRKIGKDRLCQIHCTDDDGHWLQDNPRLDMRKVKAALDEIGYSGWLTLERSRVGGKSVKENFGANAAYLKSIFQT
jgi:sugar phosphate isomerase/epimerase